MASSPYVEYGDSNPLPPPSQNVPPDDQGQNGTDDDEHSLLTETESELDLDHDVQSIASSLDDRLTWRGRMQVVLHSHWFHLFVIILVLLDSLIVLFELLIDVGAFGNLKCTADVDRVLQAEFCHFHNEFSAGCAAPFSSFLCNGSDLEHAGFNECTALHTGQVPRVCVCGLQHGKRVCVPFGTPNGVNPGQVLHGLSIAILTIFVLEVICKLIAFRFKFFTHKFEVFDATIVFLSFVLDVASIIDEVAFEAAFTLIILLRLWRVVRVVNGFVLSSKTQQDNQLSEVRGEAKKIIHILHKTENRLKEELDEKDKMLDLMTAHKIPYTPAQKTVPLKKRKSQNDPA